MGLYLEGGVHFEGSGSSYGALVALGIQAVGDRTGERGTRDQTHPHVPGTEEELSVQIGPLNNVHVRDNNLPVGSAPESHHGEVLEQLASQRAGAHNEVSLVGQLPLEILSEHESLAAVSVRLRQVKTARNRDTKVRTGMSGCWKGRSSSEGRHSRASKNRNCFSGMNLAVQDLTTSWAARPPRNDTTGISSPRHTYESFSIRLLSSSCSPGASAVSRSAIPTRTAASSYKARSADLCTLGDQGHRERDQLFITHLVVGSGELSLFGQELIQRLNIRSSELMHGIPNVSVVSNLESEQQLGGSVELSKVSNGKLWLCQGISQTFLTEQQLIR